MDGLDDLRVLELGATPASARAAKLLADIGADVLVVEPPGGHALRHRGPWPAAGPDPERSGSFLGLATNKGSVVLDSATPDDRARLSQLVADADLLITDLGLPALAVWGLDLDELTKTIPHLVVCAITPFGLTGPKADWRAGELVVNHAAGWGWLCPGASPLEDEPPIKPPGHQAMLQAAVAGALTALAASEESRRTGRGELIDLSIQAYVVSQLENAFIGYAYTGDDPSRLGTRILNPWGIFECDDGLVFLVCVEQDQWERLVEFMGNPEWTQMGLFDDTEDRYENSDLLNVYVTEWTRTWKVQDLFHQAQAQRICVAPVNTMADLDDDPHLAARQFLVPIEHPGAGRVVHPGGEYHIEPPLRRAGPAPTLGDRGNSDAPALFRPRPRPDRPEPAADPRPKLPLTGVRVLDLSWAWAGPFCTLNLAHLGADVIKLESGTRPDLGRRLPVYVPGMEVTLDTCGYFNQWGQNKRSVDIDLRHHDGIATAKALIAKADVVIDNYATGVMDRLGLGLDVLRELRSDLVIASISGYGSSGPSAEYMGYGPTTAPLSGLASLNGYEDGPPAEVGISMGDPAAGIVAAFAIVAGLARRDRTGQGSVIDVSLWEATACSAVEGWMAHALAHEQPPRMGNHDPAMAPHACYRCAGDDTWLAIECPDDETWQTLAALVDPTLADDPRFATAADRKRCEAELDALLATWCEGRDQWVLTHQLQQAGVPAHPSQSPALLEVDPQLEHMGLFERLDHPAVGRRGHTGIPWRLRYRPDRVPRPAPLLGQHTTEVLAEVLGLDDVAIADLQHKGGIGS
ncbi:MAG: CoA transferase [Acidimicrobiia bacterium]|nr:CoA transferase [Acidimicrobiia bacterium]